MSRALRSVPMSQSVLHDRGMSSVAGTLFEAGAPGGMLWMLRSVVKAGPGVIRRWSTLDLDIRADRTCARRRLQAADRPIIATHEDDEGCECCGRSPAGTGS